MNFSNKNLIILVIAISLCLAAAAFVISINNNSQNLTANVSEPAEVVLGNEPIILSVSALPQKVKVGDILTITAEIKDKNGIEKVSAIMPYENNRADEIQLSLISGDNKSSKWQGEWKCHNTINIEYITTVTAINILGKSATAKVSWWDDTETGWISGWNYRKKISIEGSTGGAQTFYQVKLLIGESSGTSGTDVNVDGESKSDSIFDDIYFADSNGSSLIDFWRESITGSGSDEIATVWIEVPSIAIGDSNNATAEATIFLYYGNPSASSASNGTNTFDFFDDFNRADNATVGNGWTETGNAQILSNNLYANDVSSGVERAFSFSSGMYCLASRTKSMVHFERMFLTNMHDGSHQSRLIMSGWTGQPNGDAIASTHPDTVILDPYIEDQFYVLEICRITTDNFNHYVNHGEYSNEGYDPTLTTTDDKMFFQLAYDVGSSSYTDWIFVRKYASPEPTATVATDEEKKPGAPGVNPSGGGVMVF